MAYSNINSNIFRPGVTHTLAVTTTSGATRTAAFATQINQVMITVTAACFVELSDTPTALVASSVYLAANRPYIFTVSEVSKASAITSAGTATAYVTELTR
jgi:hypothetical protein|tara:strand:- start:390 stop:692 length:303 start_codon:yes stop_codon:yes gene_type:complete